MADISREDAAKVLRTQSSTEVIKEATQASVVLAAFPTLRMSAKTYTQPVLAALPTAGWVGESATAPEGVKPTTEISWADKTMTAEELAVIVPVHENVLADSSVDIFAEVRPLVAQEFARKLDAAVLFGVQAPTTWADANLVGKAIAAGNTVARGTHRDLAEDFNQLIGKVDEDDFDANVAFAHRGLRTALRGLRDDNGGPIYADNLTAANAASQIYGLALRYVTNGSFNRATAEALVGDRTAAVVGIREDLQVKLLTEATVGGINLAERDMVALRFKFRVAFATRWSPASLARPAGAYPFAVLTPDATP